MRRVITYGTFDMLHRGHERLLSRARDLGDTLIVGVTTEAYDFSRGKLNIRQDVVQRIQNVLSTGLADKVILEEYEGQKIEDVQRYKIDLFVIGSDWHGKFNYLEEYCDVVYLERTPGVSSTEIRNCKTNLVTTGIVGTGRIATRFLHEAKLVSGVSIEHVFGRSTEKVTRFSNQFKLSPYVGDFDRFLDNVDSVYIATPHNTHFQFASRALKNGVHVLCEKPATLKRAETQELSDLAKKNNVVFLEAIKTAFAPAFVRMVAIAKSGVIGDIVNVDATFTKLHNNSKGREFSREELGGSFTEYGSYGLMAISKLLGTDAHGIEGHSLISRERVDIFTKLNVIYNGAIGTVKTGFGVKSEGDLIVSGTKGYIYVPAPWWKPDRFDVRFEDNSKNETHHFSYDGEGLRYGLHEFVHAINSKDASFKLTTEDSIFISEVLEIYWCGKNIRVLQAKTP